LSVVDLFCGAGGLGTGFAKHFTVSSAIDWNKDCCSTYQHNHKETKVKCDDVRNISFSRKDYDGIIGVIGGPPCQDFSILNKKRDPNSLRANLLHEMIRALEEIQPSFLMMENVYSVPADKKERFIKLLQKLDYKVVSKVVNAVDYGSVQFRRRWFVTATKKKFVFPGKVNYQRKAKEILTNEVSEIKARKETLKAIRKLESGKWVALPNQSYKVYFVVDPEKPLPAVVNPTKLRYIKPDRAGYLSLNELYSAFDFPLGYKFFGTLTSKGQQLANAVPVSLAKKFALSLKEVF